MAKQTSWVVIVLGLIWLFVPWTSYGQPLQISILDVGQGDSIFIQTPNHHQFLIDGGPDQTVLDQLDQVMPFGDRSLDAIIPSHPQADHITGLVAVLQRFKVGQVLTTPAQNPITAQKALTSEEVSEHIPAINFLRGSVVSTGDGVTLSSLWPPPGSDWAHVQDLNDIAQVDLLRFKTFSALFTADAGANIDQQIERLGDKNKITLLKVGHHGSATGTDSQFLTNIHPLISVISVGVNNRYGHPAPSTLQQLRNIDTAIYRTDQNGRVTITVDDSGISVTTEKLYNKGS